MSPTNPRLDLLGHLLDVASVRHRVIAQNIANINTPGYKELDVSFEDAFAQAVEGGDREAMLEVQPSIVTNDAGPDRADGNNVDIDFELARLNKNTLLYQVFSQLLASHLAAHRSAIAGQ
jgi:flagellar basal-body rod protein FlgB